MKTVLVTGGAGYVGAVLVPKLLERDYRVRVLDLFIFGDNVLPTEHPQLECIKGDIRNQDLLRRVLPGCESVIHLACISNDPSFELNPELSKSINFDSFEPLVAIAKESGASRFIYASSASVYGVSSEPQVTEDHPLVPITDYNKYKGLCEPILLQYQSPSFTPVIIRPATVCGYSPRQRLDLVVNILTNLAVNKRKITILGGAQQRPNLHVDDVAELYVDLLERPAKQISGKTFNASRENHTVAQLGSLVCDVVGQELPSVGRIEVETAESNDPRSYHICADKITRELGWAPKRRIEDAVVDLCRAFHENKLPDPLHDPRYYNVKLIQSVGLV